MGSQERRKRLIQKIFEKIMTKTFSGSIKHTDLQFHKAEQSSKKEKLRRKNKNKTHKNAHTPRYTVIKLLKTEDLKEYFWKFPEKSVILQVEDNYSNDCRFHLRNHTARAH